MVYKIGKDKKTLNYIEPFLWLTNMLTIILVWKQNIELRIQKELLEKTVFEFNKIQEKLEKMETLSKTFEAKPINVVDHAAVASEVNILKWLIILLIIALSAYSVYVLYMKWLGFSFTSLLPKINIPIDWLPFMNQKNFFECILGDYTLRFNISGKTVDSVEVKHIEDLSYKPLEDILNKHPSACENLLTEATEVLKKTEDAIPVALESVQNPAEVVQTLLNGIG